MMRSQLIVAVLATSLVGLAGCNGDNNHNAQPTSTAVPPRTATPTPVIPPPTLGANQIDRMGRAGVNTALTNPFFRKSVASEESMHEAIQDEFNAAADPTQWQAMFAPEIAGNLAILDSLDTDCGNQLLAGGSAVPGRYDTFAGVLADDQLYVNTASGTCQQYLAVEANFVGIVNNDCGGRTPLENTIDITYSLLAIGALNGVTNGVTVDADGHASLSVFPFLDIPE